MRLKVIIISITILIISVFIVMQFVSKDQKSIEVIETPKDTILIKKDELLTEKGNNKGEAHYEFSYAIKDNSKIHYSFSDKNKRGITFIIYNNDKSEVISRGHTNQENNFLLESTFSLQKEGNYKITIVSDDGDGGENYPISVLVELLPN
ncbi:hypothetical protein [Paenibacillus sp. N3.4]|uniref:hypothetical protein n=1 Tax=Paenibacillus sp. N3.4 TaxID=2603222 RepID=UPI0011CAAB62|nr:hypothetical protein [Paenibacillus sp. N3.4]TXK75877.1 hypothetical protein FU659_27250 [Paenibacillus sp. N3.4]